MMYKTVIDLVNKRSQTHRFSNSGFRASYLECSISIGSRQLMFLASLVSGG